MATTILITVLFSIIVALSVKIRHNDKRIDALIDLNHRNAMTYNREVGELYERIESLEFVQSLADITVSDNRQLDNHDWDAWWSHNVHRAQEQNIKR